MLNAYTDKIFKDFDSTSLSSAGAAFFLFILYIFLIEMKGYTTFHSLYYILTFCLSKNDHLKNTQWGEQSKILFSFKYSTYFTLSKPLFLPSILLFFFNSPHNSQPGRVRFFLLFFLYTNLVHPHLQVFQILHLFKQKIKHRNLNLSEFVLKM